MSKKPCYVYVIALDDLGMSKIGISESPLARLQQLQTGSPFSMELAFHFATPSRAIAIQIEAEFHRIHQGSRKNGEWFGIQSNDAALLCVQLLTAYFHKKMPNSRADELMRICGVPDGFQEFVNECREHFDKWGREHAVVGHA